MTIDEMTWTLFGHRIGRHTAALNMLAKYEQVVIADTFGRRLGHTTLEDELIGNISESHPLFVRLQRRATHPAP
jgi:hypothetical protein